LTYTVERLWGEISRNKITVNRTEIIIRKPIFLLAAILIVAAVLRFWALGNLPPGLYRDEAFNGLDAVGILRGDLSLYFAANNGREPIFFYLLAASIGALGRTPLAVRLPSAFASLLTVPALYLMARAVWNRRVGLISAAVLAVMLWPVHLAHVGFRAVLLPLFLALTVWQAALGWQTTRKRHWLAAGILYGLSFYTYLAARFTPLVLALFALYAWFLLLRHDASGHRRALQGALLFVGAAFCTILPLLIFTAFHWDIVMGRVGQASILSPAINNGDLLGTLVGNTLKALGMFFVQGDRIYRHNVPWRPVFDPAMGLCFTIGVILAIRQAKAKAGAGLALIWTAIMLLPTILAEDSPHFLRAAGVLPIVAVFPALTLETAQQWIEHKFFLLENIKALGELFVIGVLLISATNTTDDYFVRYPQDPKTAYWFDSAGVSMAQEAQSALNAGARVMIEQRLWDDWANLRFMLDKDQVRLIDAEQPPTPVTDKSSLWLVWSYDNWARVWQALPQHVQIEAGEGARYQGDKDSQPQVAYLYFRTAPYNTLSSPRAQFEQFVRLLTANAVQMDNGQVRVRLVWYAENAAVQPFIVFVHLLQGDQRIAQADSPPAGGYYPSEAWRPGDVIVDEHWLDWPNLQGDEQVMIGLYNPISGKRLNVLDASGQPIADSIALDIK